MQTPTYYRHDDASAPTLDGTAGSLIALLDAILVNGYGSKPAAGWTKPFTGTNKAVFRNNSVAGSGTYFRLEDSNDAFGTATFAVAEILAFVTMSDVDTGTGQWPTPANITNDVQQRKNIIKSTSKDATARPWIALATDRSIILSIGHASSNSARRGYVYFFGDYNSIVPSDANAVALLCGNWGNNLSPGSTSTILIPYNSVVDDLRSGSFINTYFGALKATLDTGGAVGANACLAPGVAIVGSSGNGNVSDTSGGSAFDDPPHPVFGYPLAELFICDEDVACIRGRLPSIRFCMFDYATQASGVPANFEDVSIADPTIGTRNHVMCGHGGWFSLNNPSTLAGFMIDTEADDWP